MKINKKAVLGFILMLIPYLIAAYIIIIMPDRVPTFLLDEEREWKSKNYKILICVILGTLEFIFYFYSIWIKKKQNDNLVRNRKDTISKNNNKTSISVLVIFFIFMSVINCVNLFLQYQVTNSADIDLLKWVCVITGVSLGSMLIVMGNAQPKMHDYKDLGGKIWQELKPETIRKINVFTGICLSICGVIIIIISIVLKEIGSMIGNVVLILLAAALSTIYSYVLIGKEKSKQINNAQDE